MLPTDPPIMDRQVPLMTLEDQLFNTQNPRTILEIVEFGFI